MDAISVLNVIDADTLFCGAEDGGDGDGDDDGDGDGGGGGGGCFAADCSNAALSPLDAANSLVVVLTLTMTGEADIVTAAVRRRRSPVIIRVRAMTEQGR